MSCDDITKGPPSIGHHIANIKELLWKNMIFKTKLVDTIKKMSTFVYFVDYIQTMHLQIEKEQKIIQGQILQD
jgi:hypothetical protein